MVKMLRRHETGLLGSIQRKISNAGAEGFNSAMRLIKANARGFATSQNIGRGFYSIAESWIWPERE